MKACILLVALIAMSITTTSAYDNNPPIPERHPGWTFGSDNSHVEIELFYDLLCSACAYENPIVQQFLDMPFLNSTVRENVKVTYTFIPLPYHHQAWTVTKLVPYFIDQCAKGDKCLYLNYIDYCMKHQDEILGDTSSSQ